MPHLSILLIKGMNLKSICDGHDKIKTFKENDNENYSIFYAKIIIILTQFEKANLCLLFQLKIN